MTRQRPIGSSEKEMLARLFRNGGRWQVGERALWENKHWTLQLLKSLSLKGYVDEAAPDRQYQLTEPGLRVALVWGTRDAEPPPARRRQPVHFPEQGNGRRASALRRPGV